MGDRGGVPVTRVLPGERSQGGRRLRSGFALAAILLVVLVVKPWGAPPAPAAPPSPAAVASEPRTTPGATAPSVGTTTAVGPATLVEGICGRPVGWRVAAVERWAGRMARTLTAMDAAAAASGPADPAIPFVRLSGVPVLALGYCVPGTEGDAPPAGTSATVWQVAERGPVLVRPVVEGGRADGVGLLWLPPPTEPAADAFPGSRTAGWPPGRYVVRLADRTTGYERWFGAEIGEPGAPVTTGP